MPTTNGNCKTPNATGNCTLPYNRGHAPCALESCAGPVARNPGEKTYRWQRRRYCSKQCQSRAIAFLFAGAVSEHPPCAHCGGPVARWAGESGSRWLNRTCCSADCARARMAGGAEVAKAAALEKKFRWPNRLDQRGIAGTPFGLFEVRTIEFGRIYSAPATPVETETTLGIFSNG